MTRKPSVFLGVLSILVALHAFFAADSAQADDASAHELAEKLRKLSPNVLKPESAEAARDELPTRLYRQLKTANQNSSRDWAPIKTLADWEAFRRARLEALRQSLLAEWPKAPAEVRTQVTGKIEGDGYVIEKVVYESRPGWFVTADMYKPAKPPAAMPGILLSHSHHSPKTQGELQDMGVTWARAGCIVLVPDHLGHGERAQHGFKSDKDYPKPFAVSRQDYYFRFDNSIQLYLVGDSLMGWMAWDLMRGVDVLLAQKGIDKDKIILLGGVAGGGDPCGVTAALDERISCAVPFNFGGPQPETRYPLPEDAESWFNYAGGGSWESTRNLAFSARPESRFVHWEITSSIAPRRLIHGHEFSWDGQRDPVWKRYQRVYELYGKPENVAVAHGKGLLSGKGPEASHCGNIGEFHRRMIHPAFEKWFGIKASEASDRHNSGELAAMTPEATAELKPAMLHELLAAQAVATLAKVRKLQAELPPAERRAAMQNKVRQLFGGEKNTIGSTEDFIKGEKLTLAAGNESIQVERITVVSEQGPNPVLLMLSPAKETDGRLPVVVGLARGGKEEFLQHRSPEIVKLVQAGVIVCLPDVCNCGEFGDEGRGQYGGSTDRAATALMLGDPLIAHQLRDVRAVLDWLRKKRKDVDPERIALWGESFSPLNASDATLRVPRRIDDRPHDFEPLGEMLALFAAIFEDKIAAVYVHQGLAEFRGALESPFVYIPLDAVVPGLLTNGDVPEFAASLAPVPLRLSAMVDAGNRAMKADDVRTAFAPALASYEAAKAAKSLVIDDTDDAASWLIEQLKP